MSDAVEPRPRSVQPASGERLAAWWLTLGRSPRQIVDDLVRNGHATESQAWVAVDEARRHRSMSAHPAGSQRADLRLVRMVL